MIKKPLKIFIIYAREDELYRNEIVRQLKPMERADLVQIWTDKEILAGEEWEPSIKSQLKSADIILLLVSSDYFSSLYIHDVEIKEALKRHELNEARVIPIIVRPCLWTLDSVLNSMQVLPSDAIPLSDVRHWLDIETACLDVMKGISNIIEKIKLEKDETDSERLKKIKYERIAAEQEEFNRQKKLAHKKQKKIEEVERKKLIEQKQQDWSNLLKYPTREKFRNYVNIHQPDDAYLQGMVHEYPQLKEICYLVNSENQLQRFWLRFKRFAFYFFGYFFIVGLLDEQFLHLTSGGTYSTVLSVIGFFLFIGFVFWGISTLVMYCFLKLYEMIYNKKFS